MKKSIGYQLTYAPVVLWSSIRITLLLSILNEWNSVQLDYVHAYPEAPIEKEMYMKIPVGINIAKGEKEGFMLKMIRNIYGQKQAGRVWNKFLHNILLKLGFEQSQVDECVYYWDGVMYLALHRRFITRQQERSQNLIISELKITIEGKVADFLGVHIQRMKDGNVRMPQPHLAK